MIAERNAGAAYCRPGNGASIKPRSNDRGKRAGEIRAVEVSLDASIKPRSNDRGKGCGGAAEAEAVVASIKPRSNDRGKEGFVDAWTMRSAMLQ